ncbi:MAG: collagenase [Bacteroidetes bacterium GWE2_39_28]|nr:MAG: collagenase [Bacteroidetes bacterium GWE2_39_28]OFY13497.1 MAG: collagenase [Bacteroidetes bacterium GWF2_39_10]OFZ07179.1 MAG: collagenase [Bacteroidetes bacterium RIFOXYB2_FULL_39_7]OFZ11657.1 MAG: collagenase [Bacteroidetes bacterium RIFOXYC2_FULL_39_11]
MKNRHTTKAEAILPEDIEIMAPAGNFESLMAAIQGGANSVYFGIGNLNMRSHSANNFSEDSLEEIVRICREAGVKSYLTLNIVLYDEDIEPMRSAVDRAVKAGVSAIIASDMAAILYARKAGMEVHISTQLNVSNIESVKYHAQFADVIVLARELTLNQVKSIHEAIVKENIKGPSGQLVKLELFCHGALCMAVSGKCYLSLHEYNASANRGSCYQLCRRGYEVTDLETGMSLEVDNKYIMSPKDLSTIKFTDLIVDAGIRVFKIEGRARAPEYAKTVTAAYREAANAVCKGEFTEELAGELENRLSSVFNRGFWDGYYQGARLGEWSDVYGNKATKKKSYIGKVTNFFGNLSVAEVLVETGEICIGDDLLIIGPTTGVVEHTVSEIRVALEPVEKSVKGEFCSLPVPEGVKLRRSDKIYLWR